MSVVVWSDSGAMNWTVNDTGVPTVAGMMAGGADEITGGMLVAEGARVDADPLPVEDRRRRLSRP